VIVFAALSIAFGCLYRDDFTIEPVKVVPVLAAACLLQLDGLMQQCAVIMMDTISYVVPPSLYTLYIDSVGDMPLEPVLLQSYKLYLLCILMEYSGEAIVHLSARVILFLVEW